MGVKVLFLILASDNQPVYLEFQRIWRKYMKSRPEIDCYFYKGDPNLETQYKVDGDTLWIRIEESLDTVYEKTLKAFEYFAEKLDQYDFVFRPNLSSFVVFEKYLQHCSTLPRQKAVSSFIGYYENFTFPAGTGFTMSTDVVLELVKEKPPIVFLDDVTIGKWLHSKCIPIFSVPRGDYIYNDGQPHYKGGTMENTFLYRVKNEQNRRLDVEIHERLLNNNY